MIMYSELCSSQERCLNSDKKYIPFFFRHQENYIFYCLSVTFKLSRYSGAIRKYNGPRTCLAVSNILNKEYNLLGFGITICSQVNTIMVRRYRIDISLFLFLYLLYQIKKVSSVLKEFFLSCFQCLLS